MEFKIEIKDLCQAQSRKKIRLKSEVKVEVKMEVKCLTFDIPMSNVKNDLNIKLFEVGHLSVKCQNNRMSNVKLFDVQHSNQTVWTFKCRM